MRKLCALACFVLLLSFVSAKDLMSARISVEVEKSGDAKIIELYKISLLPEEALDFSNISSTSKNDIAPWTAFLPDISFHALGERKDVLITAGWPSSGKYGYEIKLEYSVPGFAKLAEKKGRYSVFEITKKDFSFYDQTAGQMIIPPKYYLWVTINSGIPEKNIVEITPTPEQRFQGNIFSWGPAAMSEFEIRYQTELGLGETGSLERIAEGIYLFFIEQPIYGAVVLIILILTIIYRKPIARLITESFAGEEEVELPKKEL